VGARLLPPESLRALVPEDPGVALTVGGVAVGPRRVGEPVTWLSAHDPSRARGILAELPLAGPLVVHEWLTELDPYAALAEGFGLGRLLAEGHQQDRRVEPLLDFLHGLYHVTILAPPDPSLPPPEPPPHPLADEDWVRARSWAPGEPQRGRRTLQLDVGSASGVALGSAVVHGARLVGRVCALLPRSSEVALIDDPGLSLPVAAAFLDEPERTPRVLGRLTALGRDPETGLPLLHWRDALPLELAGFPAGEPVRLRLFTGTGEIGLPAGLLLGESYVRTGASGGRGQRLTLTDVFAFSQAGGSLWVRRPGPAERKSLERTP
jgi:rod shape-determining protein MreC